jgi:carboxylesterase
VRAGAEVRDVLVEMKSGLSLIRVPALLIYSKNDQTVRPEEQHAEKIYQKIGSERKSLVWIERSGHVITRDLQRLEVFQTIADFLAKESIQPA